MTERVGDRETRERSARAFDVLGSMLLGDKDVIAKALTMAPFDRLLPPDLDVHVAHHGLFAMEVFPFAGVFTSDEALVGGAAADTVIERLARIGFELSAQESPDHVGNILHAAAALAKRGAPQEAGDFIRLCLLPWLAPFVSAVGNDAATFWPAVVDLAVASAIDYLGDATVDAAGDPSDELFAFAQPVTLADSEGLGQLASQLTIPSVAGAFIRRSDIRTLGRSLELPTGFGSRRLMLTNLLRSAGEYESGGRILAQLASFFRAECKQMNDFGGDTLPTQAVTRWAERAAKTADWLEASKIQFDESS